MESALILGIDEAGRGPVLGPLVLSGVWVESSQQAGLRQLGLQDSKAYGSSAKAQLRRKELAQQICERYHVATEVAEPEEIDRWASEGGLNRLEHAMAERVIAAGPRAQQILADGSRLFAPLLSKYPQLIAEDKADRDHLVVAAASIVAKNERDRLLAELLAPHQERFGPIGGGGYPNAATARYLRAYAAHHGRLPDGLRHSWSWAVLQEIKATMSAGSEYRVSAGGR